jgi:hypothetical protein
LQRAAGRSSYSQNKQPPKTGANSRLSYKKVRNIATNNIRASKRGGHGSTNPRRWEVDDLRRENLL